MSDFWINYLFPFLTIIGLIILYFSLKNLLPSYFSEKGKNLATKEDVSEITNLVESVKYSFTKETEELKANLTLLNNVHVGIVAEERNAIVDFNEKFFKWLNVLLDSSHGGGDNENNTDLENYLKSIVQAYNDLINSETRFGLFVENIELKKYASDMKLEVLKNINPITSKYIHDVKSANLKIKFMKQNTPPAEQPIKYEELLNAKANLYYEFSQSMLANYKDVVPMTHYFQDSCRTYIYKLLSPR